MNANISHIDECLNLSTSLKNEGHIEFAEQVENAIKYSCTGLEIVGSLWGVLLKIKASGSIKSEVLAEKMDLLISDLRKKMGN